MDVLTEEEKLGCIEIERAIENREFIAYYQPQYNAMNGRLESAESLIRWRQEDGSVLSPYFFIPLAEKTDLVIQLDWYMLHEVCQFQKRRLAEGKRCVTISVNFSRNHFTDVDFCDILCDIVDSYAIPRNLIEVEVTESAAMHNSEILIALSSKLRESGFDVAIDDFGSGLSSLSLVKDMESNILKIDKSLISGNCENEKERIVLESIFDFAHRLNLITIAEGVETEEQLSFLRTCDCRLIQGYLYAKPMPEEEFTRICDEKTENSPEDILMVQSIAGAKNLLMDALFTRYPLVIMANLTKNSYYMMVYEQFSRTSCPSTGKFDELIEAGACSMLGEDQEVFRQAFSLKNLFAAYERGEKCVKVVTRQMGDDGIYRPVETADYFVKNPSSPDVLLVAFCHNLEEDE